jgi:DNA-directed RNA polymerase specialized sigma24 family protein
MGFSAGDAEDLAQDVFVTFLETIERFEGRSGVGTWLFGILHHKAQERRRAHAREDLTDAVDDVFEGRFNADGSWREPPIPADRLVAAGQRPCVAQVRSRRNRVVLGLLRAEEGMWV